MMTKDEPLQYLHDIGYGEKHPYTLKVKALLSEDSYTFTKEKLHRIELPYDDTEAKGFLIFTPDLADKKMREILFYKLLTDFLKLEVRNKAESFFVKEDRILVKYYTLESRDALRKVLSNQNAFFPRQIGSFENLHKRILRDRPLVRI